MNILKLDIVNMPYPYPQEKYEDTDWGRISLNIIDENNLSIRKVFDIQWHPNQLLDWLCDNKNNILCDSFPVMDKEHDPYIVNESIAEKISILYNNTNNLGDTEIDFLFMYRKTHGFRFGLRGTDIPDVYIGLNNMKYEISYFDNNGSWSYEIDIESFFDNVLK